MTLVEDKKRISRRQLIGGGVALGATALASSACWARYVEPDWVKVEHVDLQIPGLPAAFHGFKITQISDIHIECGNMAADWPQLAAMATRLGGDVICLTGDYISSHTGNWSGIVAAGLKKLRAPHGVFATLGNHDHFVGVTPSRKSLVEGGVRELDNEVVFLEKDGTRLALAGVDDMLVGHGSLGDVAAKIPGNMASVLMCHEPDYLDWAAPMGKFDVMLAGHSHGGQVCLPFTGPPNLPPMGRKYWKGWYRQGRTQLYTSRGLGTVGIPVRFNARPEITLFTLTSTSA